jgi:hypothetical protein
MNGVMFNDNNTTDQPQPMWWDGSNVRFDQPPAKQLNQGNPLLRYSSGVNPNN